VNSTSSQWLRVKRNRTCPVCGRPDWCLITADGSACLCPRSPNGHPVSSKRTGEFVGYPHRLGASNRPSAALPRPAHPPAAARQDLALLVKQYETAVTVDRLASFAARMGLTPASLSRLRIGWVAERRAWSFPMTDERHHIVGIRLRTESGAKFAVPGSQNGLFIPHDLADTSPLLVCEGPTSCAALLDLGYSAIGRPSCTGGSAMLHHLLTNLRRQDVVVFGDHDEAKPRSDGTTFRPGQEGATRLAQTLLPVCRSVKVVVPPFSKDPREWKRDGATKSIIDAVIRAMNYVRPQADESERV
jgi:hypothetical protein